MFKVNRMQRQVINNYHPGLYTSYACAVHKDVNSQSMVRRNQITMQSLLHRYVMYGKWRFLKCIV